MGLASDSYAHLLGLYLGDGGLSRNGVTALRLSIACDAKYPRLVNEAAASVAAVLPVRVQRQDRPGCVRVEATSVHWRCLFPQHGPGAKHQRDIVLTPWQTRHVETCPGQFVRGLVNSDGCRAINRVGRYEYVRYQFSNRSEQLLELFNWGCSLVGVDARRSNRHTMSVSRRASVEILEDLVGPKS